MSSVTKPAFAVFAGCLAFGETLAAWDGFGIALAVARPALARANESQTKRRQSVV